MNRAGALVITVLLGTLATLGIGAIALVRWARRTGRRPWLWLLGMYVAVMMRTCIRTMASQAPRSRSGRDSFGC
jgi:hypothetical protein